MSVIALLVILVVLGVIAYFVQTSAVLGPRFKWLIQAVIVVLAVLLILYAFGVWSEVKSIQVPRI